MTESMRSACRRLTGLDVSELLAQADERGYSEVSITDAGVSFRKPVSLACRRRLSGRPLPLSAPLSPPPSPPTSQPQPRKSSSRENPAPARNSCREPRNSAPPPQSPGRIKTVAPRAVVNKVPLVHRERNMLEASRAGNVSEIQGDDDDDDDDEPVAAGQVWEAQARALQRAERSAERESLAAARSVSFAEDGEPDESSSASDAQRTASSGSRLKGEVMGRVHQVTDRAKNVYKAPELIKHGSFAGRISDLRDMTSPAELVEANKIMQKVVPNYSSRVAVSCVQQLCSSQLCSSRAAVM